MADRSIAYFSMEIALSPDIPTYSGGLGVLAGDTIRSAADLSVPMIAVTLLHRGGYFTQQLDDAGQQTEVPVQWDVASRLEELSPRVAVTIEGRTVHIRAWRFPVEGVSGSSVPVLMLDTDLPENSEQDRHLTDFLYGGDQHYRLCQEVVLGIGGLRMLRALGHDQIQRFHMNEGHSSLLTLELLEETAGRQSRSVPTQEDIDAVRRQCVFTTHTPVPAGHDQFPMELVQQVLGQRDVYSMKNVFCCEGVLNLTFLAMNLSHYINGVAKRHGQVSHEMFPRYQIDSITNGIHASTWACDSMQRVFDRHIPGWREDNFSLRYALGIPAGEIRSAHAEAKRGLLQTVQQLAGVELDHDVLTIGFARRATAYKRPDLLFHDLDRLRSIAARVGQFQVIYAGKAHPRDDAGKQLIRQIFEASEAIRDSIRVVYLPGYDMQLGRQMTSGVDLWLNTPEPPLEASGTSGMKAAVNGVPSLSVPDGWWIEGCIEGVTGWAIGKDGHADHRSNREQDAIALYDQLEHAILPLFQNDISGYINVMRHAIALNGSFFNTQRMMQQYVLRAYFAQA